MIRRLSLSVLAIAAFAVMTIPASANSSASIKATISLASAAKLGSTTLAAGSYDVVVEGNSAKFQRNGKTIAEAPCTMKDLSSKSQNTGFQIDNGQIIEINVSGKTQAVEISGTAASGN